MKLVSLNGKVFDLEKMDYARWVESMPNDPQLSAGLILRTTSETVCHRDNSPGAVRLWAYLQNNALRFDDCDPFPVGSAMHIAQARQNVIVRRVETTDNGVKRYHYAYVNEDGDAVYGYTAAPQPPVIATMERE